MRPKRVALVVGGAVVVGVGIWVAVTQVGGSVRESVQETPEVTAAPIEVAVRARGEFVPARWANVSYQTAGTLAKWHVMEGQAVVAGELLATLETEQLALAVTEAEVGLKMAGARLEHADVERSDRIAQAMLDLQLAEQRLAQAGSRVPGITAAEIRLAAAVDDEARAQDEYLKSLDRHWEDPDVREAYRLALEQASDARAIAAAELDAAQAERAAAGQELAILESEVAKATLALAQAEETVDTTLAQEVERAEVLLAQAQAQLAAATLVASFDGTVTALHLKAGDVVQAGTVALTMADLETLRVETTDLDEWGAVHVAVGDPAEITVSAFDDKVLSGRVTEVALRGEELPAGDVVYRTVIELDEPDPDLRWGMTVRIAIPLEEQ